jgi:hypothetical protein
MSQDTIPLRQWRNETRIAGKHAASGERPVLVRHTYPVSVRCCRRRLAAGFAAVFYGEDQGGISEIVEADAVVFSLFFSRGMLSV